MSKLQCLIPPHSISCIPDIHSWSFTGLLKSHVLKKEAFTLITLKCFQLWSLYLSPVHLNCNDSRYSILVIFPRYQVHICCLRLHMITYKLTFITFLELFSKNQYSKTSLQGWIPQKLLDGGSDCWFDKPSL